MTARSQPPTLLLRVAGIAGLMGWLRVVSLACAATFLSTPAAAQSAGPCVYTDDHGRVVITDRASDPRCAHLRSRGSFRPPGRMRVTFHIVELISLAHDVAVAQHVDHRLVESLVEMESGYDPNALSAKGAMGLMQLMPAVARQYGVINPYDPRQNLDAGVQHLKKLLVKYRSNLEKAVAAYNAGEGAVDRYSGVPPYPETRTYVRRVLYRYRQRVEERSLNRDPSAP